MLVLHEFEVLIDEDITIFSWNDLFIQEMALELGEPEFQEARPCG